MTRPPAGLTPGTPCTVSPRLREAIGDDPSASPDAVVGPLAAVVCDAASMEAYVTHCLLPRFTVVPVRTFSDLAAATQGRDLRLIAADLYTLEHQSLGELDLLAGPFQDIPLLILSQEDAGQAKRLQGHGIGRATTVVALPAPTAEIRRLASALVEQGQTRG